MEYESFAIGLEQVISTFQQKTKTFFDTGTAAAYF